jgi:hypothetical protein
MTLPTSGPLSLSQVNTENGYATATVVSLNDSAVRSLAGKLTGQIGFNDLLGKSNDGIVASYYFNGSNNGIRMANSTNLNFGTGDFTIEFWMKANNTQTQYSTIVDSSTNNTGTAIVIGQGLGTTGKLNFSAQRGISSTLTSANTITDNTWHHIACVKFANTGFLFVDGKREANTANGAWSVVTNAYFSDGNIGRSRFGSGDGDDNTYTGWLSNFRVAKRAIYTTTFTPPNRVLAPIPDTQLLTVRNTTVVDDSGNNLSLVSNTVFPTLVLDTVPPISATYPVTIASDIANANVYNLAKSAGWDANNGLVVATVNSGVTVSSASTGAYAMEIDGGFWGGVKLVNNGTIVGRGGNAGGGGSAPAYNYGSAGGGGNPGGPGLFVGRPTILKNAGRISGGGGGGGGGGATGGQYYYSYTYSYTAYAGYGSLTYSYRAYATAYATVYYTDGGGGGGGGIGGSNGGAAGGAGSSNYPVNGAAGSGGTVSAQGAGGAGGSNGYTAGSGGAGGAYGSGGGGGSTGNGNVFNAGAGAAGAAGSAIVGYSKISIQSIGTINGATSG